MKDTIFREPALDAYVDGPSSTEAYSENRFAFNAQVATVFDDMINRSVPGYRKSQELISDLIMALPSNSGVIYDLGCSTATSLIRVAQRIEEVRKIDPLFAAKIRLIGIDSSPDMVLKALDKVSAFGLDHLISLRKGDLRSTALEDSPLTICLYTLQFLPIVDRIATIRRIWNGLQDGGLFVFAEKVKHSSPILQDLVTHLYDEYKLNNGYSQVEIIRKRQALENVLIPFTVEENISLLRSAGFRHIEIVQKDLCFVTFLAEK